MDAPPETATDAAKRRAVFDMIAAVHDALPSEPPLKQVLEALGTIAAQFVVREAARDSRFTGGHIHVPEQAREYVQQMLQPIIDRGISVASTIRTPLGEGHVELTADTAQQMYGLTLGIDI